MTPSPTPSVNYIRLHKHVQATPQRVFEALTTPEQYPKWFAPDPKVDCGNIVIEPRVGGKVRFEMLGADGSKHVGVGEITEIVENKKLSYTWSWENEPGFGENSQVTWELFEATNHRDPDQPATEIVLTHDRLNSAAERSDHTGGWWNALRAIGYYVRGVDPREAMYGQAVAST